LEDFCYHTAKTPKIGTLIVRFAAQHYFWRSIIASKAGEREFSLPHLVFILDASAESKVADLDLHVFRQKDVLWFEVSVDYICGMEIFDGGDKVICEHNSLLGGK
jgi:hypothetical protein